VNLDFLTPGAEEAVARSPMERSSADEGARFELRDGWNIAIDYKSRPTTDTVAWADVSHLAKVELHAPSAKLDELAGQPLPFGTAVWIDEAWWCRLTATRALVIGARPDDAPGVRQTDVTTTFAALTLVGPLAREVFARFSAIDLRPQITPPGALRPGSIARQPGLLICEAEDRYLMLFGWATGEYVWAVVSDAGFHLGGGPIGADALAKLPSARVQARA
jgi:glycine cleavage system aminomethyltransferase T